MTIAIALKVGDCVVLGADSASTLSGSAGVINVYFNAEKILNLRKGFPVGAVTYGLGNLDSRSITTLAKDLRQRLSKGGKWELDETKYTLEEVAGRVKDFFYDEFYKKEWPKKVTDNTGKQIDVHAPIGFMVAGYSGGKRAAEVWTVEVDPKGVCTVSKLFGPDQFGVEAKGQPEALLRLVNGWSPRVLQGMVSSGIPHADALKFLQSQAMEPLLQPAMPVQDAIDLVQYLTEVTAGFVRFIPGAPSVNPPIDLAAISFHEGFRWVRRKHYYSTELNPPITER